MRFDLVDLRLFLHVTEAGSVTRGAQRSNLALASASAHIRGMEIALGVPLLARDRRGVTLLPSADALRRRFSSLCSRSALSGSVSSREALRVA